MTIILNKTAKSFSFFTPYSIRLLKNKKKRLFRSWYKVNSAPFSLVTKKNVFITGQRSSEIRAELLRVVGQSHLLRSVERSGLPEAVPGQAGAVRLLQAEGHTREGDQGKVVQRRWQLDARQVWKFVFKLRVVINNC